MKPNLQKLTQEELRKMEQRPDIKYCESCESVRSHQYYKIKEKEYSTCVNCGRTEEI